MADTGGFLPGGYGPKAYDIIAEGLNIPPLKVIKGGVVDKDLWALVCRNVRNSNQVDMDTMLINGALAQAEAAGGQAHRQVRPGDGEGLHERDPGFRRAGGPRRDRRRCRTAPTTASRPATGTA